MTRFDSIGIQIPQVYLPRPGTDLTRWQADGVLDAWGTWIYIQDIAEPDPAGNPARQLWSAGLQPIAEGFTQHAQSRARPTQVSIPSFHAGQG